MSPIITPSGGGGSQLQTATATTDPATYAFAHVFDLGLASMVTATVSLTAFTGDGETLGSGLGDIQLAIGTDMSFDNVTFLGNASLSPVYGGSFATNRTLIALNDPGVIGGPTIRYLRVQGDWEDSIFNSYAGPNHPTGTVSIAVAYLA